MFGTHHIIGTAIGFAGNDCYLRHSRFTISIEQFGPMTDNTFIFLIDARKESRYIHKGQQRYIERITETDETGGFYWSINIQRSCQSCRLVGYHTDRFSIQPDISDHNIFGIFFLHFKEVMIVGHRFDQFLHIIGLIRIGRDQIIELFVNAVGTIRRRNERWFLHIIAGEEWHKFTYLQDTIHIIIAGEMSHAWTGAMYFRTSQVLHGHFFLGDTLYHFRPGNKHITGIFYHKNKIGQRRWIDCSSGTRSHNGTDLRDYPRSHRIA